MPVTIFTEEQAAEYNAELSTLTEKCKQLLAEYVEPPFAERTILACRSLPKYTIGGSDVCLETELRLTARKLAHTPPLFQRPDGLWEKAGMGFSAARNTSIPVITRPIAAGEIVPVDKWGEWLEKGGEPVSLKPFSKYVFNQGRVGSCTAEAGCGCLEVIEGLTGQKQIEFNPYFVYGRVNGGRDNGSALTDVVAFLQRFGACPESVWPRSRGWQATPSKEAYEAAAAHKLLAVTPIRNKVEMGSMLLQRKPVHFWYNGHSVFAHTLISVTMFGWRNSWGTNWGEGGHSVMAFTELSYSPNFFVYHAVTDREGDNA